MRPDTPIRASVKISNRRPIILLDKQTGFRSGQKAASSISISDLAPAVMVMNSVFTCGSSLAT